MFNKFSRAFTALQLVFSLWAGSLAAVAGPRKAQDAAKSGQKSEQQNKKGDDKSQQAKAPQTVKASATKPLSEKEDPRLIGKRKINGGLIAGMSGSLEKEVNIGRQLAAQVDREAKFVDDPVITEYINRVGQNVVLHSDAKIPFTIKVIDSDEVNAFALPGGYVYVTRGLLTHAQNEAQVRGLVPGGMTFEEWEKDGMAIAGSPKTVLAEIERQVDKLGLNYLLTYLFFGNLTLEQAMRSLELMRTEIMPKLEKM